MTNFNSIFGSILILILFVSCSGEQTDNSNPAQQETPQALQNDKLDLKSYGRSGDLTEELYQELVEKTPALRNLENDLAANRPKSNDLIERFNQYDGKSIGYYSSANYKTIGIKDSLLRTKINALITTSSKKYTKKTAELNSLLKQISNNGAIINDHHAVLKIVLTLPIIEKYQDDNKPHPKEFQDFVNQQEKLISRIDSLTPKY